jgi:hypothetical protein
MHLRSVRRLDRSKGFVIANSAPAPACGAPLEQYRCGCSVERVDLRHSCVFHAFATHAPACDPATTSLTASIWHGSWSPVCATESPPSAVCLNLLVEPTSAPLDPPPPPPPPPPHTRCSRGRGDGSSGVPRPRGGAQRGQSGGGVSRWGWRRGWGWGRHTGQAGRWRCVCGEGGGAAQARPGPRGRRRRWWCRAGRQGRWAGWGSRRRRGWQGWRAGWTRVPGPRRRASPCRRGGWRG